MSNKALQRTQTGRAPEFKLLPEKKMNPNRIRPSRWWHVVAAVVFLLGAIGAPVGLIVTMVSHVSGGEQFLVPGKHTMALSEAGEYVIWHDAETFYQGQQYSFPQTLPSGTTITVIDEQREKKIPTKPVAGASESSANTRRYSVCSFQIDAPGQYSIIVKNLPEQRVFMVRRSIFKRVLFPFLFALPIACAGWIIPPIIVAVVEVKRHRNKQALARQ